MIIDRDDSTGSLSIRSLVIFSAAMAPSAACALTAWVLMSRIVAAPQRSRWRSRVRCSGCLPSFSGVTPADRPVGVAPARRHPHPTICCSLFVAANI